MKAYNIIPEWNELRFRNLTPEEKEEYANFDWSYMVENLPEYDEDVLVTNGVCIWADSFSGGKDSSVIKALADMAGVAYDAHYNCTGIDPPEAVRFIKEQHPDVEFEFSYDKDGKRITM